MPVHETPAVSIDIIAGVSYFESKTTSLAKVRRLSCILTINIAHPPLSGDDAERLLDESLRSVRSSTSLRILKIIHGYGSTGKGGTLRTIVRNWCYKRVAQVRAVLPGEDASPFDKRAQSIASECGVSLTGDLGPANDGMTIVWVL